MRGRIKITKRQIKEDKFTTFMLTAKDQIVENWQFVVIGVVAVVLVAAAASYYVSSQRAKTEDAAVRFARALLDYRNGDNQIAILGLNQIIEEYSSDDAAEEATYLLGKMNLVNRNYPEAVRYFEMYLSTYEGNLLNRAASMAGIATCLENQGEYLQAAGRFVEAANEHPGGPLEGDYQLAAMRNYLEVGDTTSARERLGVIEEKYSGTDWSIRGLRLFYEKGQTQSGT